MILDLTPTLINGNRGCSVWLTDRGIQVSVKRDDGSFSVAVAWDAQTALDRALCGLAAPVEDAVIVDEVDDLL